MQPIKICKKCQREKVHDLTHQKYTCYSCKAEYAKEWRAKNPNKVKLLNIQQRENRKKFVKNERLKNPELYQKKVEAKKFCEKHQFEHVLSTDGKWICRECKRLYAKNYRANKKYKMYRRLKQFNLTLLEYNELLNKTNGKCYICNNPETKVVKGKIIDISIDHCHAAEKNGVMKVRGLLCSKCNTSLGGFKDSIDLLKAAIKYLETHTIMDDNTGVNHE